MRLGAGETYSETGRSSGSERESPMDNDGSGNGGSRSLRLGMCFLDLDARMNL